MSEEPSRLSEMKADAKSNAFVETSKIRVQEIIDADPAGVIKEKWLSESIVKGEITFKDALNVIRKVGLLGFDNPDQDRVGNDILKDNMLMFVADRGGPLSLPYQTPSNEAHYIITTGVLHPGLRLPRVIEGVRQVLLNIEKDGYPDREKGEQEKKAKVARFSEYLYALTEFQTDLITDELVRETKEDWDNARKRVVEWQNMQQELGGIADKNIRLRSLLERPVFKTRDDGVGDKSPVDPLFKHKGVKAQEEV